MNQLTKRQADIFITIENYIKENGHSPSYREVMDLVGIKSSSTIANHLKQLKKKGYVDFKVGAPRTLTINNRGE